MATRTRSRGGGTRQPGQVHAELYARLQARRSEVEQAALTRIYAVSDPTEVSDPEYVEGLRAAVFAALDYSFAGIESGEARSPALPAALLNQARLAARNNVSLDTVLRRCLGGYALIGDFLIEEAEDSHLGSAELKCLLRVQSTLFDRLIAAVTDEHTRASEGRLDSAEQRRAECVERLLAGEFVDTSELRYDFEAHHLGVIAVGRGSGETIRDLAKVLDCRPLLIGRGEGTAWGWLGARHPLGVEILERLVTRSWPARASVAIGEPGQGLAGWRLTHQQARAALPIALRSREPFVRYADVALLASTLQDDVLATSMRELYLAPLSKERDGGAALRETLRAYFAADRNASSAAVALGVSRRTVANRLSAIETRLGRPLSSAQAEIEVAVRLEELDDRPEHPSGAGVETGIGADRRA